MQWGEAYLRWVALTLGGLFLPSVGCSRWVDEEKGDKREGEEGGDGKELTCFGIDLPLNKYIYQKFYRAFIKYCLRGRLRSLFGVMVFSRVSHNYCPNLSFVLQYSSSSKNVKSEQFSYFLWVLLIKKVNFSNERRIIGLFF